MEENLYDIDYDKLIELAADNHMLLFDYQKEINDIYQEFLQQLTATNAVGFPTVCREYMKSFDANRIKNVLVLLGFAVTKENITKKDQTIKLHISLREDKVIHKLDSKIFHSVTKDSKSQEENKVENVSEEVKSFISEANATISDVLNGYVKDILKVVKKRFESNPNIEVFVNSPICFWDTPNGDIDLYKLLSKLLNNYGFETDIIGPNPIYQLRIRLSESVLLNYMNQNSVIDNIGDVPKLSK